MKEFRLLALKWLTLAALGAAAAVTLVGILYVALQVRDQSQTNTALIRQVEASSARLGQAAAAARDQSEVNTELLRNVKSTNNRLISCTTPGGECYKQSQERLTKAVASLNKTRLRVVVAALTCQSEGVKGQRALTRCTLDRMDVGRAADDRASR